MSLAIIGDIHEDYSFYHATIAKLKHSVQVGDFGFDYRTFEKVSMEHRFLGGNHDNYDSYHDCKNSLGDYGQCSIGGVQLYFVRGARSIDLNRRTIGVDWWENEELSYQQSCAALVDYKKVRPAVMVSHDCPTVVKTIMLGEDSVRTSTNELLQQMFDAHCPNFWYFGHHHVDKSFSVGQCMFVCVGKKSVVHHSSFVRE